MVSLLAKHKMLFKLNLNVYTPVSYRLLILPLEQIVYSYLIIKKDHSYIYKMFSDTV